MENSGINFRNRAPLYYLVSLSYHRKQRVQLNRYRSGWTDVRSGVPQGSVLRPLLFTIFIDDIVEEVLCEISKFADDTKRASRVNTLNDIKSIQRILNKLVA